jgi:nucleotide-binding universal stress UspA family protein
MSYKTILVHLEGGARSAARLDFAFGLAVRFQAHLVGLYAPAMPHIPAYAMVGAGHVLEDILVQRRAEELRQAEKEFRDAVARHGDASAEWRDSGAGPAAALRQSARYADLVVAGQPEPQDEAEARSAAHELALAGGRPVLFVPYAGRFKTAGRRVLIAWDAGREAARAMREALPFLRQAEAVEVAVFDPHRGGRDHGEQPGADAALYLARHGVKVSVARQDGAGIHVGEQILSRAADTDADLVVMGAYGHSRARELVLGGVTRSMIESMTLPVLMSH